MVKSPTARLIESALATFHATFFFLVFVIITFGLGVLGSLLSSLNTLVGIAIFAVLWLTTWWTTRRVLAGTSETVADQNLPSIREDKLLLRGILWGGVNGVLFFVASGFILLIVSAASYQNLSAVLQAIIFALIAATIGAPFAFLIGGIIGIIFALIDFGMLAIARIFFAMLPYEPSVTRTN